MKDFDEIFLMIKKESHIVTSSFIALLNPYSKKMSQKSSSARLVLKSKKFSKFYQNIEIQSILGIYIDYLVNVISLKNISIFIIFSIIYNRFGILLYYTLFDNTPYRIQTTSPMDDLKFANR